ncbi:MAG: sigma-70 family RNA polymerase sigma factor [Micavibrio aeruginosavorus]|uniref:Sigma-70 family RNA polymerase sigma factor n=1 Tax=Micavibrio aeruginosavorus TaxID=349221 RepID=A0A7T5R2X4_9BACT|nr:MAG: sigma-70 family RNA polymerase sigma factor [Micavibrio aeruginosavorus]
MLAVEFATFQESEAQKKRIVLLTPESERQLWQHWKQFDDQISRKRILNSYLPFCRKIATEYARKSQVPIQDLYGEAQLEMVKQFPRYNPENNAGASFATFLDQRLRGKLREYIIRNSGPVKLCTTKPIQYLFANWGALNQEVRRTNPEMNDHARQTAIAKLAAQKHKGLTTDDVREFEARLRSCHCSLNTAVKDDNPDSQEFIDFLVDERDDFAAMAETQAYEQQVGELKNALGCLDPRERAIIEARFLQEDGENKKLQDLATQFGVSSERIRQIENAALKKLRTFMEGGKNIAKPAERKSRATKALPALAV